MLNKAVSLFCLFAIEKNFFLSWIKYDTDSEGVSARLSEGVGTQAYLWYFHTGDTFKNMF